MINEHILTNILPTLCHMFSGMSVMEYELSYTIGFEMVTIIHIGNFWYIFLYFNYHHEYFLCFSNSII